MNANQLKVGCLSIQIDTKHKMMANLITVLLDTTLEMFIYFSTLGIILAKSKSATASISATNTSKKTSLIGATDRPDPHCKNEIRSF